MTTKIDMQFTANNFMLPPLSDFTLFGVSDENIMPIINRLKDMEEDEISFNDLNHIMININWELLGLSMANNNLIVDYISNVDSDAITEFVYDLPYVEIMPL